MLPFRIPLPLRSEAPYHSVPNSPTTLPAEERRALRLSRERNHALPAQRIPDVPGISECPYRSVARFLAFPFRLSQPLCPRKNAAPSGFPGKGTPPRPSSESPSSESPTPERSGNPDPHSRPGISATTFRILNRPHRLPGDYARRLSRELPATGDLPFLIPHLRRRWIPGGDWPQAPRANVGSR